MAHSYEDLGAYSVARDGTIIMASPRALQMIGYDLFELLGRSFTEFIVEDSLEEAMNNFELTLQGHDTDVVVGLKKKEGGVLRVRARSTPDRQDGEVIGAIGTIEELE